MRRSLLAGAAALAWLAAGPARARAVDELRWLAPREALHQELKNISERVVAGEPVAHEIDRTLGRLMDLNGRVRRFAPARRRAVVEFVVGGALQDLIDGGRAATEAERQALRRVLMTLEAQADIERDTFMRRHWRRKVLRNGVLAAAVGIIGTNAFEFAQAYVDWRSSFGVCPADPETIRAAVGEAAACSDVDLLLGFITRNVVGAAAIWGVLRVPGPRRLAPNHVRPALAACVRALELHAAGGPIL